MMMMARHLSCLFLTLVLRGCLAGNSNGDSLLYLNSKLDLSNKEGVLQVYIDRWHSLGYFPEGEWVNICSKDFNRGAAAAACRQLGFTDALNYGPYQNFNYELNPNISDYVLTEALCSSVSDYSIYGETHILRCSYYGTIVNSSSMECTPVGIQCASTLLTAKPYEGQIMLTNRTGNFQYSISSGYLSMFYKGQWYPVCGNVSYFGSGSACRQLGSTSVANTYTDRSITTLGIHLGDPSCLQNTFSCADHCYNQTQYNFQQQCNTVLLVCRFLVSNVPVKSSGSRSLCQLLSTQSQNSAVSCSGYNAGISVALGFMTTIAFIMTIITIIISVCFYFFRYKSNYKQIIQ